MTSVHLQSCYLNESDFINQTLRLAGPIENINSHGSSFENFHVSDKGDFVRSQLVNVTYRNDASDTIGKLAYEVYESKLVDCRITGYGENLVYNSTLRNVQISYHGHFGLNRASIDNASFNANTVDIQNKFGFFTIPLPNTLLHVYTDRNEKMCVIEQDGHEIIELSDPDFETKLQLIFINNGEIMLEDISRYVHDCVNSRDRVLKLFNKSQSCNANS